jgi:hypothetical protein
MRTIHVDIHLPWWFPGAGFKKEAEKLAPHIDEMVDKPYQTVKEALVGSMCLLQSPRRMLTVPLSGHWCCCAVRCGIDDCWS